MTRNLLPAIFWTVFVILISLTPGNEFPALEKDFEHIDKLAHIFLYAGLSFLWYYGLRRGGVTKLIKINIDVVMSFSILILGIVLEICQFALVPNRSFDVFDIAANGFGVLLGFGAFYFVIYRRI